MDDALAVPAGRLGVGASIGLTVVADAAAMVRHFAETMLAEYRRCMAAGRAQAVFIVPVGPVGQFELLAERCNAERQDLSRLVLINMDEYLAPDGGFIAESDPLSFRGHMARCFFARLDPALAPPRRQNVFPDPRAPERMASVIAAYGGVDVCFGGVGVTGHLAFNDPPEPGEADDPDGFAALRTRVVRLSRETRLINAITATRGNVARIPPMAVTVGMAEILAARRLRFYVHRPWMSAMVRLMLHGPRTARVPASLMQGHADAHLVVTEEVTRLPEPG